jgi:exoribonuclease II
MEKGTLVEFRVGSDRRLAVIDRPEGKKNFIAIDERGHSHTLHPRQIDYQVPGQNFTSTEISAFLKRVQDYLDPSSLEIAWELVTEEGGGTIPKELAQLLFSSTAAEQCYASHVLLSDDRLYFKQKGDRYEARSANQVNELKHQAQMEQQRQQEWQGFVERLNEQVALRRENPSHPVPTWQPSERLRIDALERFATFGDESSSKLNALETLNALNTLESPQGALQLLVDLGVWSPHENLFLRRSYMPVQFTSTVTDLAHDYLASAPEDRDPDRLDLTHLKVYTIDDESTLEVDDGLSIEVMPDGRERIWVHIADPTRWMTPGDNLDLEARKRCTTIYLPTGMVSMLPLELASGPMSLNAGEVCSALSFGVFLAEDGSIEEYSIHPSRIKITYRLTYEDVEEMLELGLQTESALESLANWARLRKSWRQSQGAITIDMPESSIKVVNDGEEIILQVMQEVFSRDLVAEMMIMTGEVAARYGSDHGIPLLFRGQTQPDLPSDDELLVIPPGPARACALRRCMPKSEMSVSPVRHASLGLDYYAQVTSPIRRYSDLLAHFQLKAHLRGDVLPFSEVEVEHITTSILSTVQESNFLERQTNRYWTLEFLRRNSEEIWTSMMLRWLREHEGLASILLEDLGVEFAMHFDRPIAPGDRLQLKVMRADPRRDLIDFQEVHNHNPESIEG